MGQITISRTSDINASADRIWGILAADFVNADHWVTTVNQAAPLRPAEEVTDNALPDGRTCDVAGFGRTDERITHYDPDARRFGYSIEAAKMPGFVKDAKNAWEIREATANKASVTSQATANATGIMGAIMTPLLRRKFRTTVDQLFEDLRIYAETGEVSPAKKKAQAKRRRGD